jgi:hypothetical protein
MVEAFTKKMYDDLAGATQGQTGGPENEEKERTT